MANYCIYCGTVLHPDFGLCPSCNGQQLNQLIHTRQAYRGAATCQPAYVNPGIQPIQVVQVPKTVEKTEKVHPKRKHKSIFKILLCIIMTVALLGISLAAMGIFSVRQATTEDALIRMMEDTELSELIALLGEQAEPQFYDPIKDYVLENTGLSLENSTIDRILEASELKYYLAEKAADYAGDIYNGTATFSLEQKEVYRLFRANREEMEKILRVNLSDEVLGKMADMLVNQELMQKIGTFVLKDAMPKLYYSLHFGLSYSAIAILLAVAAMILFAMLRVDFSLGILGGGITLTITGGILALPALFAKLFPTMVSSLISNGLLQSAVVNLLNSNLIFSLLIFAVGVALLLIRATILLLFKLFR